MYPAKPIVDGRVVRDEFPDWGDIIQGNRLPVFIYIENPVSMRNVYDTYNSSFVYCRVKRSPIPLETSK